MVALGEFGFGSDNFTTRHSPNSRIVWLMFVFATLFSQIIVLNMLIAIMGDTFDKVFENKHVAILKLKVSVMSDFAFLINDKGDANKFLFVVSPTVKEVDEEEDWEGKIKAIKKIIVTNLRDQKEILIRNSDKLSRVEKNIDVPLSMTLDDQIGGI